MDLHILGIDSPYNKAFIDFITKNFNSVDNLFVALYSKNVEIFALPQQDNILHMPITAGSYQNYQEYYKLFNDAHRVFVHSLFGQNLNLFANYQGAKKYIAIFWGSDFAPFIYNSPYECMDERTRRFFLNGKHYTETFKQKTAEWDLWRKMNTILNKTSYTLSSNSYTQKIMNLIFDKKITWLPFHYYNPLSLDWLENEELPLNSEYHFKNNWKKVIMLNHSGNPVNNHISLIDRLAEFEEKDFLLVAPLSYGDMDVSDRIVNYAHDKLGEQFFPIRDFLPPNEYGKFLRQTDVLLMNTFYSGGAANIAAMLHLGKKVYINSLNHSTISTYTNNNIKVFSIDSDNFEGFSAQDLFLDLDKRTKLENCEAIKAMLSEEKLIKLYENILNVTE